jgi:hypothetical protein
MRIEIAVLEGANTKATFYIKRILNQKDIQSY